MIQRFLPDNAYQAALNAVAASDSNPFVTANQFGAYIPVGFSQIFNGTFVESFDAIVEVNNGNVYVTIEKAGGSGGDLTMNFNDGQYTLNCTTNPNAGLPDPGWTTKAAVALSEGTAGNPAQNYVYIDETDKAVKTLTSGWPTTEHIKIGYFVVESDTEVSAYGPLVNQNWNDHFSGTDNMGHLAHIAERVRKEGSKYKSGIGPNGGNSYFDGDDSNTIYWNSLIGEIYQMHPQTFQPVDTDPLGGNDYLNVVNPGASESVATPYKRIQNLYAGITRTGGTDDQLITNNDYFNIVFFGVANKGGQAYSPIMALVAEGKYGNLSDAVNDVDGYDNFNIPSYFNTESSTGFLICKTTWRKVASTWSLENVIDLRGTSVQAATGAGGGGGAPITDFSDDSFSIYDGAIPANAITFNLNTIGSSRVYTAPAADGTLALTSQSDGSILPNDVTAPLGTGSPTHLTTMSDIIDHMFSATSVDGFALTDLGTGAYNLAEGEVVLRDANAHTGALEVHKIAAAAPGPAVADGDTRFICVDYNVGSPQFTAVADPDTIDGRTIIPLYIVTRIGTDLHTVDLTFYGTDHVYHASESSFYTEGFKHVPGSSAITAKGSGLEFSVNSGTFFLLNKRFDHDGFDTTASFAVVAVDTVTETVSLLGDRSALFLPGQKINIEGSTGNDGTYTVVSATYNAPNTDIVVEEDITDATADGDIYPYTFAKMYDDGASGWTRTYGNRVIDDSGTLNWDDGTGTLNDVAANDWGAYWIFLLINGPNEIIMVYDDEVHDTLADAQAATLPPKLPPEVGGYSSGVLIGKIIVKGNATTNFDDIQSPFTQNLVSQTPITHNNLSGLQPAANTDFYHSDQPINKADDVIFNSVYVNGGQKIGFDADRGAQDTYLLEANNDDLRAYVGNTFTLQLKPGEVNAGATGVTNLGSTSVLWNDLFMDGGIKSASSTMIDFSGGVAALQDGATAVTQTGGDNSTKVATTAYVDAVLAANDAMTYKGVIDASTNPNYPAADAGDTYKISVAGKIGGAAGPNVEVGDMIICTADGTATGDHATVGTSWNIIQVNIDGAVTGPASSTDHAIARFDLTTGKVIQNSAVTIDDTGIMVGGTWQGTAVAAAYGGTGIDTSSSTGMPYVTAGTWSVVGEVTWDGSDFDIDGNLSVSTKAIIGTGASPAAGSHFQIVAGTSGDAQINLADSVDKSVPAAGDIWRNGASLNFYDGTSTIDLADHDSLNNYDAAEHFTQASITTVGTITSGTWQGNVIDHERGGLEADVSAYNGLVKISGGVTSAVTDNSTNWNTAYGWGDHGAQGYITASGVTYENLNANGDVGTGSDQVAVGNHTHLLAAGATDVNATAAEVNAVADLSAIGSPFVGWVYRLTGTGPTTAAWGQLQTSELGNDEGWTSNAGTVTSVDTGTGLSGGPITTSGTIDLDFDNLSEKTGDLVAGDRLVGVSGTTHFAETISAIPLSIFNNDSGWTSNVGTVTSVATSGSVNGLTLSGGPITGSGTVTLGGTLAINNDDWSGTDLAVANGGTGLSTFGGTNTILYTSAADTLTSNSKFTYDGTTLALTETAGYPDVTLTAAGDIASFTNVFRGKRSRASAAAVQNGDYLIQFQGQGHNGTGFVTGFEWIAQATETWSGSAQGTKFAINTTSTGSTILTERFAVETDGAITFNNAYTFPTVDGTTNYYLQTNGSGQLSWVAGAGGINNLVEDTTPQLGGDLDTNGSNIQFDTAHGIFDDSNNEQLLFTSVGSAVNYINITNAATGTGPKFEAAGETNVDLNISAKGTGSVIITADATEFKGQMFSDLPAKLTPTGTTQTIDWNDGNGQIIDLESATGNVTLTLSNPQAGATYFIKVEQDSAVTRNLVWPGTVKWPGGTAPTISAFGADVVDTIVLFWDGTSYYGNFAQNYS